MILRIRQWMQELECMIPDADDRDEWRKANCSEIRYDRDPISGRARQMLYMKCEAMQQLAVFKQNQLELRKAAWPQKTV